LLALEPLGALLERPRVRAACSEVVAEHPGADERDQVRGRAVEVTEPEQRDRRRRRRRGRGDERLVAREARGDGVDGDDLSDGRRRLVRDGLEDEPDRGRREYGPRVAAADEERGDLQHRDRHAADPFVRMPGAADIAGREREHEGDVDEVRMPPEPVPDHGATPA